MKGNKKLDLTVILMIGLAFVFGLSCRNSSSSKSSEDNFLDPDFPLKKSELILKYAHPKGARQLSFDKFSGPPQEWKVQAREKLAQLLGFSPPEPGEVRELRRTQHQGVTIHALVMTIDENLTIPCYLLEPPAGITRQSAVMAASP